MVGVFGFLWVILHGAGVLYQNLESLSGEGQIRGLHQLVVEVSLIDELSRMTHKFPDSSQHHNMVCLVLQDFLALLNEFLRQCHHLCGKLRLLHLECVHLWPIRHLGYFLEDIPGPTITQRPIHSTGDVFQFPILVLQVGQHGPDPLERGFLKFKIGLVNILPRLLSVWTKLMAVLRSGRPPWSQNDGAVLAFVISTSIPNLYTTSSSSTLLMHPYCL